MFTNFILALFLLPLAVSCNEGYSNQTEPSELKYFEMDEENKTAIFEWSDTKREMVPLQQEDEECIYRGSLREDPSSRVLVTGCEWEDRSIQIHSVLYGDTLATSVNGSVELLQEHDNLLMNDMVENDEFLQQLHQEQLGKRIKREYVINPDFRKQFPVLNNASRKIIMPKLLDLPINIYLAPSWRSKFGGISGGKSKAKQILSHVKLWYLHHSLVTKINIIYVDSNIFSTSAELAPSGDNLKSLENYVSPPPSGHAAIVYLTTTTGGSTVGIAIVAAICDSNKKKPRSMSRWAVSDIYTAQTVAHETGHNLGYFHDFDTNIQTGRNKACGPGKWENGPDNDLMNYTPGSELTQNKWSDCTNVDFRNYFAEVTSKSGSSFCLEGSCEVHVGNSGTNTISATVSEGCVCPAVINKSNWLAGDTSHDYTQLTDEFALTQNGSSLVVQRTDSNRGWGMDLTFMCSRQVTAPATTTLAPTPGSLSVKLVSGYPYLSTGAAWKPICGHYFWYNNNGASLFCKKLGYSLGGSVTKERQAYAEDAHYVGLCGSGDIADFESGCIKHRESDMLTSCQKGNNVSIKITCKEKLWRDDGRCGVSYPLPNGKPGQCDPTANANEEGPCCSSRGWCGNSDAHCKCSSCVSYAAPTCRGVATLLSTSPGLDMVLCKDKTKSTCKKDFESLCPAGWNLCTPGQFNNRNDGWDYNWRDANVGKYSWLDNVGNYNWFDNDGNFNWLDNDGNYNRLDNDGNYNWLENAGEPLGAIYCWGARAGHYRIDNSVLNTDEPLNCKVASSRPGCELYAVLAEITREDCNEKYMSALCCAPSRSCGDGVVQQEEDCDDGNRSNNDDCLNSCTWKFPRNHGLSGC